MDAERAERIKTLIRYGIDWSYLVHIASLHRLWPLLYRNLLTTCAEAVPQAILDQLREHFHTTARHNLLLTVELLRLLNLFMAHGIHAIPFKGPVLAALAYGNLALREFRDLDILVHQRDVLRAKSLLIAQGYKPMLQFPHGEGATYLQARDYIFVREDGGVRVDLQWRITGRAFSFPLDTERLQNHSKSISLAGTTVPYLPPQDLLLILCVHGCKHRWERLKWICDIGEVVRVHQEADWGKISAHARSMGAWRMLALGLFLANNLLATPLPDHVSQSIQGDPALQPLAAQVRAHLFREADSTPSASARAVFYLSMRERFRDRVRYRLHYVHQYFRIVLIPNAADHALLPLPASLSPLYYLLRPIRMMRIYGLHPRRLKRVLYEWFESID
jgi:Uncharacterised nucleotidyltransferase